MLTGAQPNIPFTPHKMGHTELIRNMQAVVCRPGMYGVDDFIVCLLTNALDTIEDMTP
jgi:hypothetical protein